MKKLRLLAIVMIVGFSASVMAQVALTGNTAGAELVQVLTITNTTPLHFGTIGITSGTAGNVVMTTEGTRTATNATLINTGTQKTVALFTLTGTEGATYSIALPATIELTTTTGTGTKTISVGTLTVDINEGGSTAWLASLTGNSLASGGSTFKVAGTLPLAADQAIGVYAGTYDVTVDYE